MTTANDATVGELLAQVAAEIATKDEERAQLVKERDDLIRRIRIESRLSLFSIANIAGLTPGGVDDILKRDQRKAAR